YRPDKDGYRSFDHWAAPSETIRQGFGDCEDYAILKMALLTEAGVPSGSMSLVVLKDVRRNLYHAVLAVHTTKGAFILDNNQKRVLADEQLPSYLPLYSFSQKRSWIHGWKRSQKTKLAQLNSLDLSKIQPGESISVRPISGQQLSREQLALIQPSMSFTWADTPRSGWIRSANNPI
ncbi:MAG: transglutaminase-like cysteine peptidase, partial [Rhizobiaceae bacterium]